MARSWVRYALARSFAHAPSPASADLYLSDPLSTKLLLHTIFALDLACLGLHGEQLLHYATIQDRSFPAVYVARPIDAISFLLIAISAALMSSFLCRRAAGLFNSNMNWQALFLWGFHALFFVAFVAQCGTVALLYLGLFTTTPSATQLSGVWLWISAASDCSLTVSLYLLLRKRFDGNLSSIAHVLTTAAMTASYTSVLTLVGAVTAFAWPISDISKGSVVVAFEIPLSSLYALSLVVTLASRTERTALVIGSTTAGVTTADFSEKVSHRTHKHSNASDDDEYEYGSEDEEDAGEADEEQARAELEKGEAGAVATSRGRAMLDPGAGASTAGTRSLSVPAMLAATAVPFAGGPTHPRTELAEEGLPAALEPLGGPRRVSFAA